MASTPRDAGWGPGSTWRVGARLDPHAAPVAIPKRLQLLLLERYARDWSEAHREHFQVSLWRAWSYACGVYDRCQLTSSAATVKATLQTLARTLAVPDRREFRERWAGRLNERTSDVIFEGAVALRLDVPQTAAQWLHATDEELDRVHAVVRHLLDHPPTSLRTHAGQGRPRAVWWDSFEASFRDALVALVADRAQAEAIAKGTVREFRDDPETAALVPY